MAEAPRYHAKAITTVVLPYSQRAKTTRLQQLPAWQTSAIRALCRSYFPQQQQNEQHNEDDADCAAWSVAPIGGMGPSRYSAYQDQDKQDNENRCHGALLLRDSLASLAATCDLVRALLKGSSADTHCQIQFWQRLFPAGEVELSGNVREILKVQAQYPA